jgi:hypothetical protein
MIKGNKGPIKKNPITGFHWKDMGRKNTGGLPGKGPIKADPIKNFGWDTSKGRKN